MQAERKVSFPHITLLDVSFSMRYESVGSDEAILENGDIIARSAVRSNEAIFKN